VSQETCLLRGEKTTFGQWEKCSHFHERPGGFPFFSRIHMEIVAFFHPPDAKALFYTPEEGREIFSFFKKFWQLWQRSRVIH
jgi:hypothetical protein